MMFQAVIFDVYRTIMRIRTAPGDAEPRWREACLILLPGAPRDLTLEGFNLACRAVVDRLQLQARACGIPCPEVFWPDVMGETVPGWEQLDAATQERFQIQHLGSQRLLDLMPGAAEVLQHLSRQSLPLGIASNAQPYTLTEFNDALSPAGLSMSLFSPDLVFWSWTHGFSKPDAHVFRILTFRLLARGIDPARVLMVGDRVDNDIVPARAFGWQTWHLREQGDGPEQGGDWTALGQFLT